MTRADLISLLPEMILCGAGIVILLLVLSSSGLTGFWGHKK